MKSLIERQEIRELSQLEGGIDRYRKECASRAAGEHKSGLSLVYLAMMELIPVIEGNVRSIELQKVRPQRVPLAYHYLCGLRADAVAYITAKLVFSAAASNEKLTRTAMRLACLIEEDVQFEKLEEAEPALANSMSRKALRWGKASTRRRIMRKAASIAGIQTMGWTDGEKLKLGVKLIEEMITTTGMVEMYSHIAKAGQNPVKTLKLSPMVQERLAQRHIELEDTAPINLPMIAPPRPWTAQNSGGYLTPRMQGPFMRRANEELGQEIDGRDLTAAYAAVNRIQATEWRINKPLFSVLKGVWDRGETLGGVPPADSLPVPELWASIDRTLAVDDMPPKMRADFQTWKNSAREAYQYNAELTSKRWSLMSQISAASELVDEEVIYFPHSLDFRGRVYPSTGSLSPQSDDFAKGMLEFAQGKPLGKFGAYWLHVHIANLFGIDKVSFDDRARWVQENQGQFLDSARDPLDGHRFWCQADDPWSALAACFEYAGWFAQGDDFVSHLPIAMDGSCSGIQHFSALMRDPEGGRAVNLVKADKPSDIYTQVKDRVDVLLAESADPLLKQWQGKVDRKIVKRPCMTFAYSVTSVGIRDQISMEIRKRTQQDYLPGTQNFAAAFMLAPVVEQAIRDTVHRAAEVMNWLKECAAIIAKGGAVTEWVTPYNLPVVQNYRRATGKRFAVWFQGERLRLTLNVVGHKVDTRRQTNSVAPNFVHSLDATHLMMVVNRLADEDITSSFAMIHDSFGVHACDVDEMHFAIRDEFIKLYNQDILAATLEQFKQLTSEELPLPPERGALDLEEIRDADYFFA